MEITPLNPAQLDAYLQSEAFVKRPVIPISLHRARSHFANPRLEPDDVIMVLAEIEGRLVGYLGVLADQIHLNEKTHRAGWLSCMWVDPNVRGQGIAKKLLGAMLESWEQRILVTEFTPAAKGLYDRSGSFTDLLQPIGLRGYLRPNLAELLPRRYPRARIFNPIWQLTDWALGIPNSLRLAARRFAIGGVTWQYISHFQERHQVFLDKFQEKNLEKRSIADLNWILQYPWILPAPGRDHNSRRYHFSSLDRRFDYFVLEIFSPENDLIGLLMLSQRNRHVKVPYAFLEDRAVKVALKLIYRHLIDRDANMLSVWHPQLVKGIRSGSHPFYLLRRLKRHYIISKIFADDLLAQGEVTVQDGDADAVFT